MTELEARPNIGRARRRAQPDSASAEFIDDPRIEQGRSAIKRFASVQGVSISELAVISGLVSPNPLYNYLNGHSQYLSLPTLLAIRDAFPGTTLDELVGPVPSSSQGDTTREHSLAAVVQQEGVDGEGEGPGIVSGEAAYDLTRSLGRLRDAAEQLRRDLHGLARARQLAKE